MGDRSFTPRDASREDEITRAQMAIAQYRDSRLGWRAGAAPRTRAAFRLNAAWWRLESRRDYGADDRTRSTAYAENMLWAAERVGDRSMTWQELSAEARRG